MLRKFRRIDRPTWIFLGIIFVYILLINSIGQSSFAPTTYYRYLVLPLLSILLAFSAHTLFGTPNLYLRRTASKIYAVTSTLVLYTTVYFLLGFLFTYVQNPLAANLRMILLNIWGYGMVAIAIEYARYALVSHVGRKNMWFGSWVVFIFALAHINITGLFTSHDLQSSLTIIGTNIIPALVTSTVLTYLAFTAGLKAMIIYRVALVLIMVALPIIPKLDWYIQAVCSIILGLSLFWSVDSVRQDRVSRRQKKTTPTSVTGIAALILMIGTTAAFMSGYLSYQPVVIMSNSMQPIFSRGDAVIIQKIPATMDISIGDIIEYRRQDKNIIHRVIEIQEQEVGGVHYITKGDNSPSADIQPVARKEVTGIVRARAPVIGYPTVWLYELLGRKMM